MHGLVNANSCTKYIYYFINKKFTKNKMIRFPKIELSLPVLRLSVIIQAIIVFTVIMTEEGFISDKVINILFFSMTVWNILVVAIFLKMVSSNKHQK